MSDRIYQLKITLSGIEPPIWRRILVRSGITFSKLHKIIQAAFGWQDYHVFEFDFGHTVVHVSTKEYSAEEMYGSDIEALNAKRTKIDDFIVKDSKFIYRYDLGDNWEHEVIVEKILQPDSDNKARYPVCFEGARHRPPEDVGGVPGYQEFLEIIGDPKHPEYEETIQWAEKDTGGRKFDPEYFYLNEINRALAKIK